MVKGLESLTFSGSFDSLNILEINYLSPYQMFWTFQKLENDKFSNQSNLFDNANELSLTKSFKDIPEFSIFEMKPMN